MGVAGETKQIHVALMVAGMTTATFGAEMNTAAIRVADSVAKGTKVTSVDEP